MVQALGVVSESDKRNLATIIEAAKNDDLAAFTAIRKSDGKQVTLIVAVEHGDEFNLVPLAEMFGDNPYDLYDPGIEHGAEESEDEVI